MNIITSEFKQLFKNAIDTLIAPNALSSECILKFNNSITELCDNCIYDPITKTSSNLYNNIGPSSFINGTICPVCMGLGSKQSNNTIRRTNLAIIFDNKYFLNISNKTVHIPDNAIQSICKISEINNIKNCSELIVNSIPEFSYERVSDPLPCGLGDQDYIITMWKRK